VKKEPLFVKESDLCAAFIAALPEEWQAYAETAGWDILLAHKIDGRQIGVQAKLKLNADVLIQAAEDHWQDRDGPDYRAVLVPEDCSHALAPLAVHCRLTVITMNAPPTRYVDRDRFRPQLPNQAERYGFGLGRDWFEVVPLRRHMLPEYVPDVTAGASAPMQLTAWKIAALKLAMLLDDTGCLTRSDFKRFDIDIRRWIDGSGWLIPGNGAFVAGPRLPDFKTMHPVVWEQIRAEPEKWRRAVPLMTWPSGGDLLVPA
jgi:hypothetical protein